MRRLDRSTKTIMQPAKGLGGSEWPCGRNPVDVNELGFLTWSVDAIELLLRTAMAVSSGRRYIDGISDRLLGSLLKWSPGGR